MAPILTVKAGRAHRRAEDSNWVDAQPAKGQLELEVVDDLLAFCGCCRGGGHVMPCHADLCLV